MAVGYYHLVLAVCLQ